MRWIAGVFWVNVGVSDAFRWGLLMSTWEMDSMNTKGLERDDAGDWVEIYKLSTKALL